MKREQRKIIKAITSDDVESLDNIISSGKDIVNEKIKLVTVHTPLSFAVMSGKENVTKSLINSGADVNSSLSGGQVPLHISCNMNNKEITELLLDSGADANREDENGNNALFYLLNYVNVNEVESNGNQNKDISSTIQSLINKGLKLNHKNKKGLTVSDVVKKLYSMKNKMTKNQQKSVNLNLIKNNLENEKQKEKQVSTFKKSR